MRILKMRKLVNMIFGEKGKHIRIKRCDGQQWFVVQDIKSALGITQISPSIRSILKTGLMCLRTIRTRRGKKRMLLMNKKGLFALVLSSRKPDAVLFKKWLYTDALMRLKIKQYMV